MSPPEVLQFVARIRFLVKDLKRHVPVGSQAERSKQTRAENLITLACSSTNIEFHHMVVQQVGEHLFEHQDAIIERDAEYFKRTDFSPAFERSTDATKKELCEFFIPRLQRTIGKLEGEDLEEYFDVANALLEGYLRLRVAGYC